MHSESDPVLFSTSGHAVALTHIKIALYCDMEVPAEKDLNSDKGTTIPQIPWGACNGREILGVVVQKKYFSKTLVPSPSSKWQPIGSLENKKLVSIQPQGNPHGLQGERDYWLFHEVYGETLPHQQLGQHPAGVPSVEAGLSKPLTA